MQTSRFVTAMVCAVLAGCASSGGTPATQANQTASPRREAPTSATSATGTGKPSQQVFLYQCGVKPLNYAGRQWEVERPAFDSTNTPPTFSGFGDFTLDGDTLHFVDRKGARIDFTVENNRPPPNECA